MMCFCLDLFFGQLNMIVQVSEGVTKQILKLAPQNARSPQKGQKITVHCTGMLENGTKFWSTKDTNQPFSFQVGIGKVIKGWDQGCITMKEGEEARLTCRGDHAYGMHGFPQWGIGPNATLIFDIAILSIE
jgi:peptidylprolyl isomerase